MKRLFCTVFGLCCIGLLSSCGTMDGCTNGGCGYGFNYYSYPSQCGGYSCTDNYRIIQYSNPCPGPYQCRMNMDWV